ncbi:thioredoxin domain protein, partial [Acinetobacter baumannii OIFC087]
IKGLNLKANFDVFVSLSCHNCPDVVQALNLIAIYNPNTTATMIDGAFFQDEVEQRKIMAVPMVFQDNEHIGQGRMTLEEIVAKLDTNSAEKDAAALNAKDAFDVLVIGGGPAGATAAIYAHVKALTQVSWLNALVVRSWTPWTLKTSLLCKRPKVLSLLPRWKHMFVNTMWIS